MREKFSFGEQNENRQECELSPQSELDNEDGKKGDKVISRRSFLKQIGATAAISSIGGAEKLVGAEMKEYHDREDEKFRLHNNLRAFFNDEYINLFDLGKDVLVVIDNIEESRVRKETVKFTLEGMIGFNKKASSLAKQAKNVNEKLGAIKSDMRDGKIVKLDNAAPIMQEGFLIQQSVDNLFEEFGIRYKCTEIVLDDIRANFKKRISDNIVELKDGSYAQKFLKDGKDGYLKLSPKKEK